MKNLSVFCSGKNNLQKKYVDVSNDLISLIDEKKYRIVYGGGTSGLMGEVRKKFLEKGGTIITSNLVRFEESEIPDTFIFDKISDRQQKLMELGDIFLVLPGGIGTIFEAIQVLTSNYIGEFSKEIILLNYNNLYDNLIRQMDVLQEEGFLKYSLGDLRMKVFDDYKKLAYYLNELE